MTSTISSNRLEPLCLASRFLPPKRHTLQRSATDFRFRPGCTTGAWMRNEAMHSAVLSAAVGICAIVAYQDVRTRRIPNALSLAMAAVGLVRIAFAQDTVAGGYTVAAGL